MSEVTRTLTPGPVDPQPLRWHVGDVTVTRIVESETASIGAFLLPDATPEAVRAIPWLAPFLDSRGRLLTSIHALLVESQGRRILVDTCVGNDKQRPLAEWNLRTGPFLEELAAAGAPRESVDTVLCTHLHVDHVGWNTMRVGDRWEPTFRNARYLFARREWEHWQTEPEEFGPVIADSVRPIVEAGLADLVETDHRVSDEIRLEPTPGHTPGHVSVRIRSAGAEAVITGDLLHHPCQIARPDWRAAAVDWDAELGETTRRGFLARTADAPVLVIGTHFAAPTAGRIVRDGDGYRLRY
jgi:glyoxylase-like metal-dependent hydrolase (beta-lactamase superfamily II)